MEIHGVKTYRHLFFDLDHTLWDFQANSREVLAELCAGLLHGPWGVEAGDFIRAYEQVNAALWLRMEDGLIPKEVLRALRFRKTLEAFNIHDGRLARELEKRYMESTPLRGRLMPGASALLEDLRPHYRLHIITNGFTDTQGIKLRSSGIRDFFDVVLTSEMAGVAKPSVRIFRHAMRSAGARPQESLMVGDNARADVAGGRGAGMDQVHFAPAGPFDPGATYRIVHLDGLRPILLRGGGGPPVNRAGSRS